MSDSLIAELAREGAVSAIEAIAGQVAAALRLATDQPSPGGELLMLARKLTELAVVLDATRLTAVLARSLWADGRASGRAELLAEQAAEQAALAAAGTTLRLIAGGGA